MHNISEQIYAHAARVIAPFSSASGATWAAVPTGPDTHESWPLASRQFRNWLSNSFMAEHEIFPGRHALNHAITLLQARARFDSSRARQEVFDRIGYRGRAHCPDALVINLANETGDVVEITTHGWAIRNDEARRFRPVPAARPLPRPADAPDPATLTALLALLLPLPKADLNRIAVWMFSALRPAGPYPPLILTGPPSSGKSTTARILRALLDPNLCPVHTVPASERELFRHALHNRVLAFDHVPSLTPPVATALARMAAGTAFTENGPHAYDDPLPFSIERPVILTVPYTDTASRNWGRYRTLQSLALTVHLPAIAPERVQLPSAIAATVEHAAPQLLAVLSNAASAALTCVADIPEWIRAAAPVLGITAEEAISALNPNPLVAALQDLLAHEPEWTGTVTALQSRIQYEGSTKSLTQQLLALPLAIYGISYRAARHNAERTITLTVTDVQRNLSRRAATSVTD
jgi:hypothetical protein